MKQIGFSLFLYADCENVDVDTAFNYKIFCRDDLESTLCIFPHTLLLLLVCLNSYMVKVWFPDGPVPHQFILLPGRRNPAHIVFHLFCSLLCVPLLTMIV